MCVYMIPGQNSSPSICRCLCPYHLTARSIGPYPRLKRRLVVLQTMCESHRAGRLLIYTLIYRREVTISFN